MIRRFSWRLVGATQVGSTPSKFLHVHDSFLTTTNAAYLDQMTADSTTGSDAESSHVRNSVPLYEWSDVMRRATQLPRSEPLMNHIIRPAEHPQPSVVDANSNVPSNAENGQARGVVDTTWLEKVARVSWMIRAWETRGHLVAAVDPLSLGNSAARQPQQCGVHPDELDPSFFGFSSRELDQTFPIGFSDAVGGLLSLKTPPMTLRELDQTLRRCYAGSVGYEFMHIRSVERTSWLRERIETPERVSDACTQPFTSDQRRSILRNLARAELFERFLHTKFVGVKRFGLDGAESLIPGMAEMLQQATDKGIEHVVIGMPHRGRLNVLANICQKPLELVFREFQGLTTEDLPTPECTGDVKYHLGISQTIHLDHGKPLHVTLLPNPSHLEAVNPLVEGTTRAKQTYLGGDSKVLSVQLHGDASFAGQGVCYETMGFCELENYRTGGTIHIVVNNQIGFTTDPKRSRSSPYCTDLGRLFGCPILHVNGDHPEDVVRAFRLAIDWRDRFKSSIILDLVCYRRYGHNESDEPMFTQPEMYRCIKKHPSVLTQYAHKLLEAGPEVLTMDHFESIQAEIQDRLKAALRDAPNFKVEKPLMRSLFWSSFKTFLPSTEALLRPTGLTMDRYQHLSEVVATIPESVKLHPVLKRVLQARVEALRSGRDLDWGAAEALAFGSLLQEGTAVRISGQDVERGTFSHRHAVVHDQDTDAVTCVLRDYGRQGGSHGTALFVASNSHLSEYAVLGFETGYSMEHPNTLVIWEAQFGDFANGAQIIFDQFLSSSEAKWNYPCGIVINLPHGYDGAGPEHSSGRLERFLQMVHEPEVVPDYTVMEAAAQHQQVNMQVVYPSTPANYFHVLRRQIHRNFRKPLILFYSKAFLRAPNVSQREDFLLSSEPTADGSSCGEAFRPVLPDPRSEVLANVTSVRRVVLCSGQISHYLLAEAKKHPHHKSVAILRLEQFAPFPHAELVAALSPFDAEAEVVWVQEEPRNMGAWSYLEFRLEHVLERVAAVKKSTVRRIPRYIGRPASASPATGHKSQHDREHRRILQEVF